MILSLFVDQLERTGRTVRNRALDLGARLALNFGSEHTHLEFLLIEFENLLRLRHTDRVPLAQIEIDFDTAASGAGRSGRLRCNANGS